MPTPGATRSGLAAKSIQVGPRELNAAITSSLPARGALMARGADRQHPRRIARRRDAAELRFALGVSPEVARGGDHDDAGVDRAPAASVSGSVLYDSKTAGGDRQVDDADVVGRPLSDRVVDRGDDVADVAVALGVEHLQADQVGAGRDAGAGARGVVAVAGDDAGDVRAVAEVVVRRVPSSTAR